MADVHGSAEFSPCGLHRFRLDRWWSDEPRALVCMRNPSTAGANWTDPTICRLRALLQGRPGIGGFTVVNADDRIATDPRDLDVWLAAQDVVSLKAARQANLERIRALAAAATVRIAAWGNLLAPGLHADRVIAALSLNGAHPLQAFALTGDGAPIHPLARGRNRVPLGMPLVEWRACRTAVPATIDHQESTVR
ncbi:DUF1643 domain-containing protein [Methylobacterium currus]|uniref:DUF1643 domain-containing protein n=1 Tax=Methylobacterium currus TaxID=2051553 RepID=UPI001E4BA1CC|nr:DUF1643 domain-containing protein [Methylobacterium currus]UHC14373.1 DUF1643 domain-containing protein [Methylobacterium currus]